MSEEQREKIDRIATNLMAVFDQALDQIYGKEHTCGYAFAFTVPNPQSPTGKGLMFFTNIKGVFAQAAFLENLGTQMSDHLIAEDFQARGVPKEEIQRAVRVGKILEAAKVELPIISTPFSTSLERIEMLEAMARARGLMP